MSALTITAAGMSPRRATNPARLAQAHQRALTEPTISVADFATLFGIAATTVRTSLRRGDLNVTALRFGARTRLLSKDVLALLHESPTTNATSGDPR